MNSKFLNFILVFSLVLVVVSGCTIKDKLQESTIEEPVIEEPIIEEPVIEEPIIEEPAPIE